MTSSAVSTRCSPESYCCVVALQRTVHLFLSCENPKQDLTWDFVGLQEVSFLLPALLGLLLDCATRPDQTLAAISMGALVRLAEVGGHQFNEKDWATLLDSIR